MVSMSSMLKAATVSTVPVHWGWEAAVSLKDKLEVGIRPDAPYRKDNLPEFQQDDPACQEGARPDESLDAEQARKDCDEGAPSTGRGRRRGKRKTMTRNVQ